MFFTSITIRGCCKRDGILIHVYILMYARAAHCNTPLVSAKLCKLCLQSGLYKATHNDLICHRQDLLRLVILVLFTILIRRAKSHPAKVSGHSHGLDDAADSLKIGCIWARLQMIGPNTCHSACSNDHCDVSRIRENSDARIWVRSIALCWTACSWEMTHSGSSTTSGMMGLSVNGMFWSMLGADIVTHFYTHSAKLHCNCMKKSFVDVERIPLTFVQGLCNSSEGMPHNHIRASYKTKCTKMSQYTDFKIKEMRNSHTKCLSPWVILKYSGNTNLNPTMGNINIGSWLIPRLAGQQFCSEYRVAIHIIDIIHQLIDWFKVSGNTTSYPRHDPAFQRNLK